jgi:hypothetical protein
MAQWQMEGQLSFACHGMKLNSKLEVELPSCYGLIKFTIVHQQINVMASLVWHFFKKICFKPF